MGVWLGPRGAASGDGKEPLFTITKNGSPAVLNTDYYYAHQTVNGAEQWELAILTNCVVNFSRVGKVDLFYVSGGQAGSNGSYERSGQQVYGSKGGKGGDGGKKLTKTNVQLQTRTDYSVEIGAGGYHHTVEGEDVLEVATNTAAFGYSTTDNDAAAGSEGGQGAITRSNSRYQYAAAGVSGAYAFGESTSMLLSGRRYGPGGGGAESMFDYTYSNSSSHGGSNSGGTTGAGDGGNNSHVDGYDGEANTGSGGGGAYADNIQYLGTGGAGGSGILIVRDHRG